MVCLTIFSSLELLSGTSKFMLGAMNPSLAMMTEYTTWEAPDIQSSWPVMDLRDDMSGVFGPNTLVMLSASTASPTGVDRIDGGDGGRLKRIMTTMILGDFTSVYLAYLYGVDPTPVEKIDFLKQRLQEISG